PSSSLWVSLIPLENSTSFTFAPSLFGAGIALDAFELCDGHPAGYHFQIIGDPEEDLLVLFGRLIEKMRRALSTKHLTDGEHGLQIAEQRIVRRVSPTKAKSCDPPTHPYSNRCANPRRPQTGLFKMACTQSRCR